MRLGRWSRTPGGEVTGVGVHERANQLGGRFGIEVRAALRRVPWEDALWQRISVQSAAVEDEEETAK